MLACLVVQQVEKVLDGQRDGTAGAEDDGEEVVHELLQRPLKKKKTKYIRIKLMLCNTVTAGVCVCVCVTFMESRRVR